MIWLNLFEFFSFLRVWDSIICIVIYCWRKRFVDRKYRTHENWNFHIFHAKDTKTTKCRQRLAHKSKTSSSKPFGTLNIGYRNNFWFSEKIKLSEKTGNRHHFIEWIFFSRLTNQFNDFHAIDLVCTICSQYL